jgi:hypothetical protein
MKKVQPGEAQAFLSTLTPKQFTWIGRTAMFRVEGRGTFKLGIWTGGTHGQVCGLDGVFTADAGTQEHITFRFEDHLVSANPLNHPNYKGHESLCVIEHCAWDWYIARPASIEPLHGAIRLWVETYAPSKHFSRAKGPAPTKTGGAS